MPTRLLIIFTCLLCLGAAKKKAMEAPKPGKPELTRLEPRGIQPGADTRIKLTGTNLLSIKTVKLSDKQVAATLLTEPQATPSNAWIKVSADPKLPRGAYDLSLSTAGGDTGKLKLYVDDLPHIYESDSNASVTSATLPFSFWGTLNPASDSDEIEFVARSGQGLVIETAAKMLGSKANINVTLFSPGGEQLAHQTSFEGEDPLLFFTVTRSGKYRLRISEDTMAGSLDHFYRVSISERPFVTGVFPLSVQTNSKAKVELIGFNLAPHSTVEFNAENIGEITVPLAPEKYRSRKALKVLASDTPEAVETEPNESISTANSISVPSVINGRIQINAKANISSSPEDYDYYRFDAAASQRVLIETDAARRGSPVDTKIEVLHEDGKPVERVVLQAVRDSQINFRSIDSVTGDIRVENWEEMDLNQFMYLKGEVCKIFRMPEGPDSGFQFYRNAGRRIAYFDTSTSAHALDEPCYVVEPHPPGTQLVPNGLPVFTLHYANDDDGDRKLGADSKILFTAPAKGTYLVRVTDSRGFSGDRFAYRLIVRDVRPNFMVTLGGNKPTVSPGSGQEFTLTADRIDGFDDAINVTFSNVPEGFSISSPIVIQAGHLVASGTITAAPDAKEPTPEALSKIKIIATAQIEGKEVAHELKGFQKIAVGEAPKLLVAIEPYNESDTNFNGRAIADKPLEITISPGQTVPVWLKIKRLGHEDVVNFTVDNLPHGVIVDNIGLNGVLIPKDENVRQIFLRCGKWVPNTDRLVYCQARQAGNPTSLAVLLRVRNSPQQTASK